MTNQTDHAADIAERIARLIRVSPIKRVGNTVYIGQTTRKFDPLNSLNDCDLALMVFGKASWVKYCFQDDERPYQCTLVINGKPNVWGIGVTEMASMCDALLKLEDTVEQT